MKEGSAPSPEPKALPQLDYAAAPPRWQGWRGWIVFGLAMAALAFVSIYWGPGFCRRALVLCWQRQCLNYTAPADQVVYEEEPKAAARMLVMGPEYSRRLAPHVQIRRDGTKSDRIIFRPNCWQQLLGCDGRLAHTGFGAPGAVVFLHDSRSPNGTRYLAEVEYLCDGFVVQWIAGFNYLTNTIVPGSMLREPTPVPRGYMVSVGVGGMPAPPNTRVYAGQSDPADPSHFTIRYEMWGQTDVVDGYINDSGGITLKQRNPPRPPGRTDGPR